MNKINSKRIFPIFVEQRNSTDLSFFDSFTMVTDQSPEISDFKSTVSVSFFTES